MDYYNPYELIYMSRTGDEVAVKALFSQYAGHINTIVKSVLSAYPSLWIYTEDFRQEARLALLDAVDSYRDDRGTTFETFLNVVIRRRLYNVMRGYRASVRSASVPEVNLDSMINEEECFYDVIPQQNHLNEPSYYTDYRSAEDRLQQCIGKLNSSEYAVYRSMCSDEDYGAAAEKLHCTRKAYDGKVQRLRRKIRNAVNSTEHGKHD